MSTITADIILKLIASRSSDLLAIMENRSTYNKILGWVSSLVIIKENQQSALQSLNEIKAGINRAQVEIDDIQFLFDANGRFVVNDPQRIIPKNSGGDPDISIDITDDLINYIESL